MRIAGTHCGTTYARNVRGAGHGGASASGCLDHWTLRLDNDRPAFTSPRVRRVGSLTTSREHTYKSLATKRCRFQNRDDPRCRRCFRWIEQPAPRALQKNIPPFRLRAGE